MEDTIAAISTAIGEGGIAIIRISGPQACDVADRIFVSKQGRPSQFPTHSIHLGTICSNGDLVDQVMLTVMRAPRTYTGEDTVEVNCHGGVLTTRQILSCCLQNGARLAEPGEFTKRAFLNGRLDLTQAEAVMDVISARTELALVAAERALEGRLSQRVDDARERLLTLIAHIEAHIDFPEEDIDTGTRDRWLQDGEAMSANLLELLATAREGRILRYGIRVAIIGRPNAGKSSLMNALLCEDRSIVTPIPGTTRDTIEETLSVRGIPVVLTDTAGIRRTRSAAENAGIRRTRKALSDSELVLHVMDGSRLYSKEDKDLAKLCNAKHRRVLINKVDLPRRLQLPMDFPTAKHILVSATRGDGLPEVRDELEAFASSSSSGRAEPTVAINDRQAEALRRAVESLADGMTELRDGAPAEVVSQSLGVALSAIGEVVGKTTTEDILTRIFSKFCIGK